LIRGKAAERVLTPESIAAGLKIEETVIGKGGKEKIEVRPYRRMCLLPIAKAWKGNVTISIWVRRVQERGGSTRGGRPGGRRRRARSIRISAD